MLRPCKSAGPAAPADGVGSELFKQIRPGLRAGRPYPYSGRVKILPGSPGRPGYWPWRKAGVFRRAIQRTSRKFKRDELPASVRRCVVHDDNFVIEGKRIFLSDAGKLPGAGPVVVS